MQQAELLGFEFSLFTDATVCHCTVCGSTQDTVARDGEVLGITDPVCCEVQVL